MSDRKRKRQEYRGEQRDRQKAAGQRQSGPAHPVWPIGQGWKVYTSDQAVLGTVEEAPDGEPYVVVRRGLLLRRVRLYVPLRFVRGAGDGRVMLRTTKAEALTWRQQPLGRRSDAVDDTAPVPVASRPPSPVKRPARAARTPLPMGRRPRGAPPPIRSSRPAAAPREVPPVALPPTAADVGAGAVAAPQDGPPAAMPAVSGEEAPAPPSAPSLALPAPFPSPAAVSPAGEPSAPSPAASGSETAPPPPSLAPPDEGEQAPRRFEEKAQAAEQPVGPVLRKLQPGAK